jgi:hypothetical protein
MRLGRLRPRRGSAFALLPLFVALALPGGALASDTAVRLSVLPVGQVGSYFDLTMRPGESRTLEVEVANKGSAGLAVATYAADVYTITNGGYGGRLRGEPRTGTTTWLRYPTDIFELAPGDRTRRAFTVTVPDDAASGEYITSIVLENDQPVAIGGATGMDQFVRHAVAVVVTVPGPRTPALAIGEASHAVLTGRSVVFIELDNGGNVRLRPVASFELRDAAGGLVSQASIALDTIYAHTSTRLEVPLAALLQPGTYHVALRLLDAAQGLSVERADLTFLVEPPPATTEPGPGSGPALTAVNQAPGGTPIPLPAMLALLGAALLGSLGFVALRRARNPSGR